MLTKLYAELERLYGIVDNDHDGIMPRELRPEIDRLNAETTALQRAADEVERPAREAAAEARQREQWAAQEVRVAALPVHSRSHGWEVVFDAPNYVLRHPVDKSEIYRGKLGRCRDVAKECEP